MALDRYLPCLSFAAHCTSPDEPQPPPTVTQDPDRAEAFLEGDTPHKAKHQAAIMVGTGLGALTLLGSHKKVLISFEVKRKKLNF